MQLAILHPAFDDIGGAQITAARQARLFQGLGADVRIRTFAYDGAIWDDRVGDVRVDAYSRLLFDSPGVDVPFRVRAREVDWVLDGLDRFDVVLAHNFPTNAAVGLSGHSGLKLWYCHEPARLLHPKGANPNLWRRVRRLGSLERHAARYFLRWSMLPSLTSATRRRSARDDRLGVSGIDEIWANSEFTRDNVHRVFGSRSVEVVYPVIEFRTSKWRRSGIDRRRLSILSVSRLERHKNLDTLLAGFATFVKDRPAFLHVVGKGEASLELQLLARSLGIRDHVTFHGFMRDADLDELASVCDVFALLPVDEPFGMVFPEAASQGLLLLGPDHGGPIEILDHGRLGQTVDAFDPEAVTEGLERIWRMTDAQVDRQRELASRACRERFSAAVAGAKMTALLKRRGIELSNGR